MMTHILNVLKSHWELYKYRITGNTKQFVLGVPRAQLGILRAQLGVLLAQLGVLRAQLHHDLFLFIVPYVFLHRPSISVKIHSFYNNSVCTCSNMFSEPTEYEQFRVPASQPANQPASQPGQARPASASWLKHAVEGARRLLRRRTEDELGPEC